MLILFAPGPPREEYFTELTEIRSAGRKLTEEEWVEVWARHDQYLRLGAQRSFSEPPGGPAGARGTGAASRDDAEEAVHPW